MPNKLVLLEQYLCDIRSLTGRRGIRKGVRYLEWRNWLKPYERYGVTKSCWLVHRYEGEISGRQAPIVNRNGLSAHNWKILPEGGEIELHTAIDADIFVELPPGTAFFTSLPHFDNPKRKTIYVRFPDVDYSIKL